MPAHKFPLHIPIITVEDEMIVAELQTHHQVYYQRANDRGDHTGQ